ncbi:hypothetical protein [Quatrionicoccus australiensis]|uniref:hypothetical protein n=1 Tax=Quatrionicoccus australiensis TaxID=138118 RepID=UPI001CFACEC4|nr:hypothetical protein [Quatrionicoccus australiensis]MCB4359599.1 hypothetical protein [Quatrionicoccus australiensis]
MKYLQSLVAAAALCVACGSASAVTLSVDVPISLEVVPSCEWVSIPGVSLTPVDVTQPSRTHVDVMAWCDDGVAWTIKSDADTVATTLDGGGVEDVTISLWSDAGYSLPLATGPGISGTTPIGDYTGGRADARIYIQAAGQAAGGGFAHSGQLQSRTANLIISY